MLVHAPSSEGVYLHDLDPGTVIDVETKSRHYMIEYVGGDEIRISGHPSLCPSPIPAELRGSLANTGLVEHGFVGRGMRLEFRRLNDDLPVITSAIVDIKQVH